MKTGIKGEKKAFNNLGEQYSRPRVQEEPRLLGRELLGVFKEKAREAQGLCSLLP